MLSLGLSSEPEQVGVVDYDKPQVWTRFVDFT